MINLETFMMGLLITSTLTGLVTEAIKKIFVEHNIDHQANTLAGVVSLVLSAAIGIAYVFMSNATFNAQVVIYLIALVFASWLCSMIGYDKVIQTINQFKNNVKDDEE